MTNHWYGNIHTTTIPVEFKNGKIHLQNGKKLPKIKEGAKADIIIASFYIEDKTLKEEYNKEEIFTLFGKGTKLYVEMNIRDFKTISEEEREAVTFYQNNYLVEIELFNDLKIKERGTKFPRLESCDVKTTQLKIEAKSLNEIYSKLSLIYEGHRMSHTGNVFDKVYFKIKEREYIEIKHQNY